MRRGIIVANETEREQSYVPHRSGCGPRDFTGCRPPTPGGTYAVLVSAVQRFFECNAPGVIFERFEDETVVINLDSGRYYTLDPMGAEVWRCLNQGVALDQLIAAFRRDYDGDADLIEASVREFVALLLSEQLMRPTTSVDVARGDGAPAPRSAPPSREAFRSPTLAKYDDMAEMLLLDPVHDVNEAGWPSAAPAPAGAAAPARVEDEDVSAWPTVKRDR